MGKGFPAPEDSSPISADAPGLYLPLASAMLMATDGQTTGKCAFRSLGGLIKAPGSSFRSQGAL